MIFLIVRPSDDVTHLIFSVANVLLYRTLDTFHKRTSNSEGALYVNKTLIWAVFLFETANRIVKGNKRIQIRNFVRFLLITKKQIDDELSANFKGPRSEKMKIIIQKISCYEVYIFVFFIVIRSCTQNIKEIKSYSNLLNFSYKKPIETIETPVLGSPKYGENVRNKSSKHFSIA
jgi:hypothetical protein